MVAALVAGSACGQLASPEAPEASRVEQPRTAASGVDAPVVEPTDAPTSRARLPEVVESVELVPVEPASPAPREAGGSVPSAGPSAFDGAAGGVYDLSVRIDADDLDGSLEDARLMMASDADTEQSGETRDGKTEDGEPVPLPADRGTTSDGETHDGEPVPLPADEKSDSDSSDEPRFQTFEARGGIVIIFPNLQLPPHLQGEDLSVELVGPDWRTTAAVEE